MQQAKDYAAAPPPAAVAPFAALPPPTSAPPGFSGTTMEGMFGYLASQMVQVHTNVAVMQNDMRHLMQQQQQQAQQHEQRLVALEAARQQENERIAAMRLEQVKQEAGITVAAGKAAAGVNDTTTDRILLLQRWIMGLIASVAASSLIGLLGIIVSLIRH